MMKEIAVEFTQMGDSCGPEDDEQRLRVELLDAGGGKYAIISTERWAVDTGDQLRAVADKIDSMLAAFPET